MLPLIAHDGASADVLRPLFWFGVFAYGQTFSDLSATDNH
jgi:hypothetical protein